MKKYFTAKYDLIFQQALCLEKDKDLLTWFLEKIFNQKIINLEIKTPVLPIRSKIEKRKTVDLLITFEDKIVNLEVNSSHYKYLNEIFAKDIIPSTPEKNLEKSLVKLPKLTEQRHMR